MSSFVLIKRSASGHILDTLLDQLNLDIFVYITESIDISNKTITKDTSNHAWRELGARVPVSRQWVSGGGGRLGCHFEG